MSDEISSQLEWPYIDGTQYRLFKELEALGASLERYGNSSVSSRNGWIIRPSKDAELNEQNLEAVNILLEQGKAEVLQKEYLAVEQSMEMADKDGILKIYTAGGSYDNPQDFDPQKYQELDSYRSSCSSSRDSSHYYTYLVCDKEKFAALKDTVLELPNFDSSFINYTVNGLFRDKNVNLKIGQAPHFTYIVNGDKLNNLSQDDIDLNNPQALKAALYKSSLRWPSIRGDQADLSSLLESKGYKSEHEGRSGIANRNAYRISKPDTDISDEALAEVNQAIAAAEKAQERQNESTFNAYFDEQSPDANKVYAAVNTGGDYSKTMDVDRETYDVLASTTSAYTADHRYGRSHTYLQLMVNKERMKEDKRSTITLSVPKDLMGVVIGKGGSTIKALSQKYGKNFKVVQDSREIEKEKVAALEAAKREHQYEIEREQRRHKEAVEELEYQLVQSFGTTLIDAQDDEIAIGIVQYLENNKESVSVISSREDLEKINEGLKSRRQTRKEKRAKINSNNIEGMSEAIQDYVAHFEKENQTMISPEQLQSFIKETATQERIDYWTQNFEGDKSGRAFEEGFIEGETAHLAERQKEAAHKIKVMKDFDKVAKEEFNRFFANDAGSHGENYFGRVGKDRRASGYKTITIRTLKKLGLYEEVETNDEMEPSQCHRRNHKFYDYIDRVQEVYESSQAEGEDLQQYVVNPSYEEEIGQEERILTPEEKAAEKERLKAAKKEAPQEEVDVSILLQAFGKKKGRK